MKMLICSGKGKSRNFALSKAFMLKYPQFGPGFIVKYDSLFDLRTNNELIAAIEEHGEFASATGDFMNEIVTVPDDMVDYLVIENDDETETMIYTTPDGKLHTAGLHNLGLRISK